MWRPLGIVLKRNRGTSPAQRHFIALLQQGLEKVKSKLEETSAAPAAPAVLQPAGTPAGKAKRKTRNAA
jgi:hypothetical protein